MIDSLWLLVLGMGAVTYIPRMLPMVTLENIQLPPFWNRFLRFVPFAALSALIFPGILSSTGNMKSALAGGVIAVLLALLRVNLVLIVLGGILAAFFCM
ncbi:AzlD domain-containing protein [Effusibacillus pohliae]|uniref:AzlD domain-containing protein n=1 Tax=Effusibacillus pohliae TaxID=232270 RepID=UPI00036CF3AA|nr:AzlD domain-containing protein [Effusibacillus pohliae]